MEQVEAASPIVSTEVIFIKATFEAYKGWDVTVMDLSGAFLNVDVDEEVIMLMEGRLAKRMTLTSTQIYRTYITVKLRDQSILFIRMQKVLYGMLKSALPCYKKLLVDLEEIPCVTKKW